MSRIVFETERPPVQASPGRADIACFVGLMRSVGGATLPAAVQSWLALQGWVDGPFARPIDTLTDIPIPIESYSAFTSLFADGNSAGSVGTDYVAAAVRSFFAQGGKRCYVVCMGLPVTSADSARDKAAKLRSLLPDNTDALDDQRGWHGAGHLAGLPDVSFLALPDLPMLAASTPVGAAGQPTITPSGPEQFVECSNADLTVAPAISYGMTAPRLTLSDYGNWAAAVRQVLLFLSNGNLREMLLVAAFPLPFDADAAAAVENPGSGLASDIHVVIQKQMKEPPSSSHGEIGLDIGISSAFLQLAYPWLRTTGSAVLLESLEPPDGVLTGMLARNALTRSTFNSATKIPPAEVYDVSPVLPALETSVSATPLVWGDNSWKPLIERVSLFGPTPGGLALLSDVTAYAGESYRPGRIHRLVAVILRAARQLGERIAFDSNGPRLWARVQTFLNRLMTNLWQLNALDGDTIAQAFSVRCDRSTMSQNDLDNGRLVALVSFNAASTIELIRVTLALQTSGASSQNVAALAVSS